LQQREQSPAGADSRRQHQYRRSHEQRGGDEGMVSPTTNAARALATDWPATTRPAGRTPIPARQPEAPPICCITLTRPDAAPASAGRTPARDAPVSGTNPSPLPIPKISTGTSTDK